MNWLFIQTAFAQATINISPAIPGLNTNGANAAPGAFIANFYQFALLISGILAFGAIVYGGVLHAVSAGNPSKQSEGKSWIWSALLGLLLLGGAYIILNTINPNLLNLNLPTLSALNIPTPTNGGNGSGLPGVPGAPGSGLSSAQALTGLGSAGVTVKPGASVDGMQLGTVNDIETLAGNCSQTEGGSCNIVITSATDGSHAEGQCSHANGYKADLRPNSSLDSFVTSLPKLGTRSDGATLYIYNGGTIADERNLAGVSPHWDLSGPCP